MKKNVNLTQFKNLVKRIIKEEKNNLEKKKTVIFTESQLRNQVRKMLREYDEDPSDWDYPQTETHRDDDFELPTGEGLLLDWTASADTSGMDDHPFHIQKAIYYPNSNIDKSYPIDIYEPKYKRLLDEVTKIIVKYLDDSFGSSDPNQGIERWN